MESAKPYYVSPAFSFVAYGNRDSTPFREWYKIPEAETVIRGTLRYQGFPEFILALVKLGFLDEEAKSYLVFEDGKPSTKLTWSGILKEMLGSKSTNATELETLVKEKCQFKSEEESKIVLKGLRWIGLFDNESLPTIRGTAAQTKDQSKGGNLLDTLCSTLEDKCRYERGERDMVMLQHRFEVKFPGSDELKTLTSSLLDYGIPEGFSSMAKLVGVPCAIATKLILEGHPGLKKVGIVAPYDKEVCDPIRLELNKEGITLTERWI